MLFNSLSFAIFLPVVFALYWFVFQRNLKVQNFLIVVASYFFYGWWDWRFLSLIFISTFEDYFVALQIKNTVDERKRKMWLLVSILVNIGFLGFFKYYNFFIDNFVNSFALLGFKPNVTSLKIILPVGISFYTFQTLSYTIDVYRRKLEPTKDFIAFTAFVSFFPLLVAGPIERANNLLPQFFVKRSFDYKKAVDGMRQILWGLFKKIVIADNCATYVNMVFDHPIDHTGSTLLLGAIFFAFQIYGDFSGYSDIAIGTARLFGINAMRNFNFPYFSRDIAEFWRRWHISLTTWFRDYVYIPLGGSRVSKAKVVRNTFIIFLVSGFWHGANWTFIVWGAFHAMLFLPLILLKKNRKNTDTVAEGKLLPNAKEIFQIVSTFLLVTIGWVFFRANNIAQAFEYLGGIFSTNIFPLNIEFIKRIGFFVIIMIFVEWLQRKKQHGLEIASMNEWLRRMIYILIIFSIIFFSGRNEQFIYFQF